MTYSFAARDKNNLVLGFIFLNDCLLKIEKKQQKMSGLWFKTFLTNQGDCLVGGSYAIYI